MDITIKDVPVECEQAVLNMARIAVERYKRSLLVIPEPDMTDFDNANNIKPKDL